MKEFLKRKTRTTSPAPRKRPRLGGWLLLLVIIAWIIIFELIRSAFRLGGSPILTFIVMLVLFFGVLFVVRFGVFRLNGWWRGFRPGLVRFLAKFYPSRRN